MRILHSVFVVLAFVIASSVSQAPAQYRLPPDAPRPIEAADSLWAEELTSMEIRDAIRTGTTTIIVGTGGVEQNGPFVAGGKHNFVLQTVLPYIAQAIGGALIAPIVKFVPEGNIEPTTSGHMQYAGTISVESATFEALLTDICRSYKAHGFMDIILLGDSGGNQEGMERVARSASAEKHHCQQGSEFPKADTQPGVAPIPSVDMQSRRIEPTVGSSPVRQLRKSMEEHNAGSHLRAEACLQHMHHQAVPVVHETRTDTGRENRRIYGPI